MLELKLRRKAGTTRCPFCLDACEAREDVAVCTDCLSRHHQACWQEAARCASCRADEALGAGTQQPDPWRLSLPDMVFAELCVGLLALMLIPATRLMHSIYESMGITLPWITKAVLSNPTVFALVLLALIPIGAGLERRDRLRGGAWAARACATVALFGSVLALLLPFFEMQSCLC